MVTQTASESIPTTQTTVTVTAHTIMETDSTTESETTTSNPFTM